MWNKMPLNSKLSFLASYSTVDAYLLEEDDDLMAMLRGGCSVTEAENHIDNNY
jgi:hypothetical protein